MNRNWYKYFIYISLTFLIFALINENYLKLPKIYSYPGILLSLISLFAGFIANGIGQHNIFKKCGYPLSIYHSFSMIGLNIFGKYIPGKMWLILGKATYISDRCNYKILELSLILTQTQLIAIWCGLIVGIAGLLINNTLNYFSWISLLLLGGITFILFSKTINSAADRLLKKIKIMDISLPKLYISKVLTVLPWFLVGWLLWGVGFYILCGSITDHKIPASTAFCFPIAATLGILFILSPGGIGIREGIIVWYLSILNFTPVEAITIAAASRLWFLIGEFIIFLIGIIFDRKISCSNS